MSGRLDWCNRRHFVGGLVALGACATTAAIGQSRPLTGAIDVHHHFGCEAITRFLQDHQSGRELYPIPWDAGTALADMDLAGVSKALLSQFVPFDVGTPADRRNLARDINVAGARLVRDHPGRFGLFVTLPMTSEADNLAEIAHGLDVLRADGVVMMTSVGRQWLGDRALDPIYAELDRRRAIVFVHPHAGACCSGMIPAVPDYIVEFGTDTARAIGNLIWSGTTTRFPNIRFTFSHCGGTMPFLIERFLAGTSAQIVPGIVTRGKEPPFIPNQPPRGPLAELRRMYFDTAQCSNPVALRALRDVVTPRQILYGSDYGYRTNAVTARQLRAARVFTPAQLRAIESGNARRLFGW